MSTDAAAAAAAQAAALKAMVNQILSPVVLGTFFSCFMMGIVGGLVTYYFTAFPHDRLVFRLLVSFLLCMAIADTAVSCAWSYVYALFFTWRVWIISGRKAHILVALNLLLILFGAGVAIFVGIKMAGYTSLFGFLEVKSWVYAWLSVALAADGIITLSIIYYLWAKPRALVGSETPHSTILTRLVIKSFQTNLVALLLQVVVIVIAVTQTSGLMYAAPGAFEAKVYISCVLITLNARTSTSEGDSTGPSHNNHNSNSLPSSQRRFKGLGTGVRTFGSYLPTRSDVAAGQADLVVDQNGRYTIDLEKEDELVGGEKGAMGY
ncbi:hypothetical protein JCM6882_009482 [Rhodosporidiobolus microsporus]